jgi:hypothetical protein
LSALDSDQSASARGVSPAEAPAHGAASPDARCRDGQRRAAQRAAAVARSDEILASIRGLPGLGDFWATPSVDSLRKQAAAGPIVIVTTDHERCGAPVTGRCGCTVPTRLAGRLAP